MVKKTVSVKKAVKKGKEVKQNNDELKNENEKMAMLVQKQRKFFLTGKTLSVSWRKEQLILLYNSIINHEQDLLDALRQDLNKSSYESFITEIGMVLEEIRYHQRHIKQWSKPKNIIPSIINFPSTAKIFSEPYGVSLIMSPWNYPFMLTMEPLVGAISAGNCAVIKPSRYSTAVSLVMEKIISDVFPQEYIAVVLGGHLQNTALLNQHFDFIFFTGSISVGKIVMQSAAQFLTPVCLELGGKSPCIIDKDADIAIAARRIVWGKCINAGQTCVAPDYVLVHKDVEKLFMATVKKELVLQYGQNPIHNNEYCKIINDKHFERLTALCPQAISDMETNKIVPTIIELGALDSEAVCDSPLMQEEIFGPLLPVITYSKIDDVIDFVNDKNKPLALYLFTNNKDIQKKVTTRIRYGGGCINDVIFHVSMSNMPFGGVGESGMGSYHGKASFVTFSHSKSILHKSARIDSKMRYAPYKNKLSIIKFFFGIK